MKFEPHLPQLPSMSELLEHPRVKGVVQRINRSTVAQRATGFLEELRITVAERAGKFEVPPMAQLADRLVRRLLGEPASSAPAINATGLVVGNSELSPPLADVAIHAMMQQAGEYHDRGDRMNRAIEREFCQLSGAEGACVLSRLDAAITVAIAATAANREALLAGSSESAATGVDWLGIAARSGVALRHCEDFALLTAALAAQPLPAALIRSADASPWLASSEAASSAKSVGVSLIDVAPLAGFTNPQAYGLIGVETIGERIASGADLVIVDGAGLVGGPGCGILFGKRPLIEAAQSHPLARFAAIDPLVASALHATVQLYRDDEQGIMFTLPVWQLLSTPIANLQQRAERLAALIDALPGVASAQAVACESAWLQLGELTHLAPDWAIEIRPERLAVGDLVAVLAAAPRPIVAVERDGNVVLRLRSVFPRWDQQLVAEIERAAA